MKIISPFKDYYDHIAHIYGGGDPKIVYVRSSTGGEEVVLSEDGIPDTTYRELGVSWYARHYGVIVIAGFPVLLVRQCRRNWPPANHRYINSNIEPIEYGWRVAPIREPDPHSRYQWWLHYKEPFNNERRNESYRRLAIKLKEPVFIVEPVRYDVLKVDPLIPKLGEIGGLVSMFPAAQTYQNIAYFLGNTIHANPDGMPPPIISNDEKAVSQGFDPKKSFRPKMKKEP